MTLCRLTAVGWKMLVARGSGLLHTTAGTASTSSLQLWGISSTVQKTSVLGSACQPQGHFQGFRAIAGFSAAQLAFGRSLHQAVGREEVSVFRASGVSVTSSGVLHEREEGTGEAGEAERYAQLARQEAHRRLTAKTHRTGAFQRIPIVQPAEEHLSSSIKKANQVPTNKNIKNEAQKARNKAARQLDLLTKQLAVPLGQYVKGFPPMDRLHPFEQALLELTIGDGTYQSVLARVDALRKSVLEVGKAYASRASRAQTRKEALALAEEGFDRLQNVFLKNRSAVDDLKDLAKRLRGLPVVEPYLPTLALVGAPNVGKSSLVQVLSSGLPEVCNYPFTTRSIKMGHFYIDGKRHQVTDTPGLLARPDDQRNAMERLTVATLEHLPTAVLFVADLTGECGTCVADQWSIRQELKTRFPHKLWLDVLSKADLLEEEFDEADRLLAAGMYVERVETAVELAVAVPDALRVSSINGDGIDKLKMTVMNVLSKHTFEEHKWGAALDDPYLAETIVQEHRLNESTPAEFCRTTEAMEGFNSSSPF